MFGRFVEHAAGNATLRIATAALACIALFHPDDSVGWAAAALVLLCAAPLSLLDAGFLLTFGATIAILVGVPRALARWPVRRWSAPVALLAASAASELALLPVGAHFFARVTLAGLVLNLAVVPLMSIVQVGGLLVLIVALIAPGATCAAPGATGSTSCTATTSIFTVP